MPAALVAGERDPGVLAELAKGRLRAKLRQLRQALRGRFGEHHALLVRLAVAHLEQLKRSIAELDAHVDQVLVPFAQARDRFGDHHRVGKRAAETMIAEIGTDMRVFPTVGHLLGGALPGQPPHRRQTPLRQAHQGQPLARRGADRVRLGGGPQPRPLPVGPVLAAGPPDRQAEGRGRRRHSILVIAWYRLTDDCDYADLGGDDFVRRDSDRPRQRAVAQLQASATASSSNPWRRNTQGIHVSG
jgi:transposase